MLTRAGRTVVLALCALWLSCGALWPSHADSWGPPRTQFWSKDHSFVLTVDRDSPADDANTPLHLDYYNYGKTNKPHKLTLWEKRGQKYSAHWSIPLPQGVPPYEVYITSDGRYVVLRDQHGDLGHGKVLVFLGPTGGVLATYTLDQLLAQKEILECLHSVSSIHWSSRGLFTFRKQDTQFAFMTQVGTIRAFDLATGQPLPEDAAIERDIRQQAIAQARAALASSDTGDQIEGAYAVGRLDDKDSIPSLIRLLGDTTRSHKRPARGSGYSNQDVQMAAGIALAKLMKGAAIPLLEPKLAQAKTDASALLYWVQILGKTGAGSRSRKLLDLTDYPNQDVREWVFRALLEKEMGTLSEKNDGSLIRQHPAWLQDKSQEIRYLCVRSLAEHALDRDEPAFKRALQDSDSSVRLWAIYGLTHLHRPDSEGILRRASHHSDHGVAFAATLELARRGDTTAMQRVLTWMRTLPTLKSKDTGIGTFEIEDLCRLLAEKQPAGAVAALRTAHKDRYTYAEPAMLGALAALNEKDALESLRAMARQGDPKAGNLSTQTLERADAVRWLGIVKDHESEAFLRESLHDREPWIREAAIEALQKMGLPLEIKAKPQSSVRPATSGNSDLSRSGRSRGLFLSTLAAVLILTATGGLLLRRQRKR